MKQEPKIVKNMGTATFTQSSINNLKFSISDYKKRQNTAGYVHAFDSRRAWIGTSSFCLHLSVKIIIKYQPGCSRESQTAPRLQGNDTMRVYSSVWQSAQVISSLDWDLLQSLFQSAPQTYDNEKLMEAAKIC